MSGIRGGIREIPARTSRPIKRQKPWPLERAEMAVRHNAVYQEERDRADAAVQRANLAASRARENAIEELTRWHMREQDLVGWVYKDVTRALSAGAAPEIAARVDRAWRETEPHERMKAKLRDAVLSSMTVDVRAQDTVSVVNIEIAPMRLSYATDLSVLQGFPWRNRFEGSGRNLADATPKQPQQE